MKLAVFLDVDKTLTEDYIQRYYAEELGCKPQYEKLEDDLKHERITSAEFGKGIIALFASKNLTEARAKQIAPKVVLRDWAKPLLRTKIDKYLVSSGPSYYIDEMIKEYGIPQDRVLRSYYGFGDDGVIESCEAVNAQQKQDFAVDQAAKYDITIGIGDDATADGPFVGACTISMLTEPNQGYMHVANFNSVTVLIDKLLKASKDAESLPVDKLKNLTLLQAIKVFSVGLWATFCGVLSAAFAIGAAMARLYTGIVSLRDEDRCFVGGEAMNINLPTVASVVMAIVMSVQLILSVWDRVSRAPKTGWGHLDLVKQHMLSLLDRVKRRLSSSGFLPFLP